MITINNFTIIICRQSVAYTHIQERLFIYKYVQLEYVCLCVDFLFLGENLFSVAAKCVGRWRQIECQYSWLSQMQLMSGHDLCCDCCRRHSVVACYRWPILRHPLVWSHWCRYCHRSMTMGRCPLWRRPDLWLAPQWSLWWLLSLLLSWWS